MWLAYIEGVSTSDSFKFPSENMNRNLFLFLWRNGNTKSDRWMMKRKFFFYFRSDDLIMHITKCILCDFSLIWRNDRTFNENIIMELQTSI